MFSIEYTTQFKKDLKKSKKQGKNLVLLDEVQDFLENTGTVPKEHVPHGLTSKFQGLKKCMECHITPDWLLVWKEYPNKI